MIVSTKSHRGVRSPLSSYDEMFERWEPIYDLMGGTLAMRKNRKWLPQEPKESDEHYACRVRRTFLYNAYRRTVKALVGGSFMKPIKVSNLPKELEYILKDADGCGQSITSVAATLATHLLLTGRAHPIVDMPVTGGFISQRDLTNGVRPYINPIDPRNLIGWRVSVEGGKEEIKEVRIIERDVELDENYFEAAREYVRVIGQGYYQIHGPSGPQKLYIVESEGEFSLDRVPIVPIYEEKVGTFVADPPLEDLAWLNIRHWQSSSDQNNILHVARVPILLGTGFSAEDLASLEIGASAALFTNNAEANLRYVEHTGNAIGAGRDDLEDLEKRMAHMGSDILTNKSVDRQTTTSRSIDKAESLSTFQVILRNLERGLEQCLQLAGEWIDVDASEVQVSIGDDLTVPHGEANSVDNLMKLLQDGSLDTQEFFSELKRRGIVAPQTVESFDPPRGETQPEREESVEITE